MFGIWNWSTLTALLLLDRHEEHADPKSEDEPKFIYDGERPREKTPVIAYIIFFLFLAALLFLAMPKGVIGPAELPPPN